MDALSLYAQQTRGYDPLAGYQRGVALAGQLLATQAQQQQQVFNNLFEGAKMVNQRRQFEQEFAQRQEEVAFNQNMEERKLAIQQQQFDERMKLDQMRTGLSMANTAARMQAGALRTGAGGEVPRAEVYQSGDLTFARTYDSTGKFTDRLVPGQGGSASTPAQQMPLGPLGEPRPEAMQSAMQGQTVAPTGTSAAGEAPLPMVNIGAQGDIPNPLLPPSTDEATVGAPPLPATTEPLRTPSEVLGTAPSSGEFTGVPISSLQTQAAPATITQAGTLAPQVTTRLLPSALIPPMPPPPPPEGSSVVSQQTEPLVLGVEPEQPSLAPTGLLPPDQFFIADELRQGKTSNAELVSAGPLRTQGQVRKFQNPQIQDSFQKAQRGEPQVPYFFKGMGPTADGKGGTGVIYDWVEGSDEPLVARINNGSVGEFRPYGALGTVPIGQQPAQAAAMLAALKKNNLTGSVKVEGGQLVYGNLETETGTDAKATGSLGYIAQIKNEALSKALMETALKALEPISEQDIALDLGVAPETLTPEQIAAYRTKKKGEGAETVYNQLLAYYGKDKMPMTKAQVLAEYDVAPAPADPTKPQQTNADGTVEKMYVPRPKSFAEKQKEKEADEEVEKINQGWTQAKNWMGGQVEKAILKKLPSNADRKIIDEELDSAAWDIEFDGGSIGDMVTGLPSGRTFTLERILKQIGLQDIADLRFYFPLKPDDSSVSYFTRTRGKSESEGLGSFWDFLTKADVSNKEVLKAWARSRLTERRLLTPEGTRAQVAAQPNPAGLLRDETGTVQQYRDPSGATVKVNVR